MMLRSFRNKIGALTRFVRVGLLTAACLATGSGNVAADPDGDSVLPLSNLELMREIAAEIGFTSGSDIPLGENDTLWTVVRPKETAWYVESSLLQGIAKHGCKVLSGTSERGLMADFGLAELAVQYSDARSEGILGETVVDREVTVVVSTKIVNQLRGEILVDDDISGTRRDTIALSAIKFLENPNIAVTQGELPTEGFFSNLAGPLIVLGALGIAVYLLFHVRS